MRFVPWRIALGALALAMMLAMTLVDARLELHDARTQQQLDRERSLLARDLLRLSWLDRGEHELLVGLRGLEQRGKIIKKSDGIVEVDSLVFQVRNGKIHRVDLLDMERDQP